MTATPPLTATPSAKLVPVAPTPVPHEPDVPKELNDLAGKPLFKVAYTGVEQAKVAKGLPFFGQRGVSKRDVTFSNEFSILTTSAPMIKYAASTLQDAIRSAQKDAFDWSDPSIGGAISASVGVAILQTKPNEFFTALIGSGNPQTSGSALSYRSDRFDNNIDGIPSRATDLKAASDWTAPVDKKGQPVQIPAPGNDKEVRDGRVHEIKPGNIESATPMLKAIVDIYKVLEVKE